MGKMVDAQELAELAAAIADMRAGAAEFDQEADLLERQADERYADSAWRYRGGSSTFVRSIDTADGYRREAVALRLEAAGLRAECDEAEKNIPALVRMRR